MARSPATSQFANICPLLGLTRPDTPAAPFKLPTTCSRPAGLLNTVLSAAWFPSRGPTGFPKWDVGDPSRQQTLLHPRHKSTSCLSCGKNSENQVQNGAARPVPSRREGPEIPSWGDEGEHRWGRSRRGDRRCHHRTSHTRKKANASSTPMSPTMELFVVKDCQSLTSPPAKVQ